MQLTFTISDGSRLDTQRNIRKKHENIIKYRITWSEISESAIAVTNKVTNKDKSLSLDRADRGS